MEGNKARFLQRIDYIKSYRILSLHSTLGEGKSNFWILKSLCMCMYVGDMI